MVTGIAFAPLLLIAAALIIFVIYMIIYSASINKKVRSGERKKSHIPSSGSVGFTVLVVGVVVCILVCLSKITSLENEVQNIKAYEQEMYQSLEENINSIDEKIKKQNSLFTSAEMKYGQYHKKTHIGDILVTLIPKDLNSDTEIMLTAGGKEYVGEKNGSAFTFIVEFDIINDKGDYFDFVASITTGGVTKTETLEFMNFFGGEQNFVNVIFTSSPFPMEYKDGKAVLNGEDSPIEVEVSGKYENKFDSAKLIIEKNGNVVFEKDISSYFDNKNKNPDFRIDLNESFDAENGDEFLIYVTAHDNFGLVHKSMAMQCEIQGDYCTNDGFSVFVDDYSISME